MSDLWHCAHGYARDDEGPSSNCKACQIAAYLRREIVRRRGTCLPPYGFRCVEMALVELAGQLELGEPWLA